MIWRVENQMTITDVSPVEELLKSRGHNVEEFLNPSFDQLHDPLLMKDMEKGRDRMLEAIAKGERVEVFGDYDADGITSTYTSITLLAEAGADVHYRIPDRKDGYGMSNKMIDAAYKAGTTLIMTCDNGISCVSQTEYAKTLGIDVIITDHHEPQDEIPNALAVINPKQHDCPYPFKHLAGCAVAWKFCQAILDKTHPKGWMKSLDIMEIVATGTIADVVDLVGENRVIVHFGLEAYQNTNNIGLQQLIRSMELDQRPITAHSIGFSIGPALNATGRLVKADEAVEMLLENSRLRAMRSANYLADLNRERKEWTQRYAEEILNDIKDTPDKIIVYTRPDIPEGIVGVIASRIKEALHKPILLLTLDESGQFYKGSGRSIEDYDLFENIMKHKELFLGAGGHAMACGFSIKPENIPILQDALNEECTLTEEQLTPKLLIDYDIDPEFVTLSFTDDLDRMKPFGKGNAKPQFFMSNVFLKGYRFVGGEQQHLQLTIERDGVQLKGIGFSMAEKFRELIEPYGKAAVFLDLAFYPEVNEWNNRRTVQLNLKDIRVAQV